jgi:hypothetical protein
MAGFFRVVYVVSLFHHRIAGSGVATSESGWPIDRSDGKLMEIKTAIENDREK